MTTTLHEILENKNGAAFTDADFNTLGNYERGIVTAAKLSFLRGLLKNGSSMEAISSAVQGREPFRKGGSRDNKLTLKQYLENPAAYTLDTRIEGYLTGSIQGLKDKSAWLVFVNRSLPKIDIKKPPIEAACFDAVLYSANADVITDKQSAYHSFAETDLRDSQNEGTNAVVAQPLDNYITYQQLLDHNITLKFEETTADGKTGYKLTDESIKSILGAMIKIKFPDIEQPNIIETIFEKTKNVPRAWTIKALPEILSKLNPGNVGPNASLDEIIAKKIRASWTKSILGIAAIVGLAAITIATAGTFTVASAAALLLHHLAIGSASIAALGVGTGTIGGKVKQSWMTKSFKQQESAIPETPTPPTPADKP